MPDISNESPNTVFLPELNIWLNRLGASPTVMRILLADPMLFASFYISAQGYISLPEELLNQISAGANKVSRHDDLMPLIRDLSKLGPELGQHLAAFTESFEVASYFRHKTDELIDLFSQNKLEISPSVLDLMYGGPSSTPLANNVWRLQSLFELSSLERSLLVFALALKISPEFGFLFESLFRNKSQTRTVLPVLFDCDIETLEATLSTSKFLRFSGLVKFGADHTSLTTMSPFWVDKLCFDKDFFDKLIVPLAKPDTGGAVARILPEESDLLKKIFKSTPDIGVNILFYGSRSVDKTGLVYQLAKATKTKAYALNGKLKGADINLTSICYVAQHWLAHKDPNAVLVVEKSSNILTASLRHIYAMFGLELDEDEDPSDQDYELLKHNPIKTVWIANSAERLTEENLSKFLFHCEAHKGSLTEHRAFVESLVDKLGISPEGKADVMRQRGLSEKQLATASKLAQLVGGRKNREKVILMSIKSSQKALSRRDSEALRIPVTSYSLDYLNVTGKFKPATLLQALRKQGKGTLCLYGLPGTGKTQFAEHLALELDKPLVMKRASDLMSKWVGETEKNIAAMFQEAADADAILFLDEADSFLRDRTMARVEWEVSKTNELLQRMERFDGIFICATNLFRQLDSAALRRFTFKLQFLALSPEQRWEMFLNETGLRAAGTPITPEQAAVWQDALIFIQELTPGDFATVKRQCNLLETTLTPDEWLGQLSAEAEAKRRELHNMEHLVG